MSDHDVVIIMKRQLDVQEQIVQLPLMGYPIYHKGELRTVGTSIVEPVFVLHAETRKLKQYFCVLRRINQNKLLRAKAFTENGESSFMAVEPFDCCLLAYLQNQVVKLANLEADFNGVYRTFQKLIWQIIEGLLFIHTQGFFHGNLTLDSTCVVNTSTTDPQIKLAGIECIEKQKGFNHVENRRKDFQDLKILIQNGLQILDYKEDAWKDLIQRLENCDITSNSMLGQHPAFWITGLEICFLGVVVGILKRSSHYILRQMVDTKIKEAFEHNNPLEQILGSNLAKSVSQRYDMPWKIYVLLKDALEHVSDGKVSSQILNTVGREKGAILQFFKGKYRNIILDLWVILKDHEPDHFIRAVSFCQY